MVTPDQLTSLRGETVYAHRLVNSRFPPIDLFDDVSTADEFEMLYRIQALTNPRLQNELGRLELLPRAQIPFGIPGCSYACAPFTHVNPAGSRFSDGGFGALYLADTPDTALAEVRHHQQQYWAKVPGLSYERFVFRGLQCTFTDNHMLDALPLTLSHPVHAPDSYTQSRHLGRTSREAGYPGLRYLSVRQPGSICWVLMTPRPVISIVQTAHYEMIWNGAITSVNRISAAT